MRLDAPIEQKPLIHGDARSVSIAAASILAKVERDRLMAEWDMVYPQYGLRRHKGYATPGHLAALRLHGPSPHHRFSFSPVREACCWASGATQAALPLRLADGAANPYLLQAAILAAGLDGIASNRDPGARLDINMYTHGHLASDARKLPLNLLDALRALERSPVLSASLGDFLPSYLKLRRQDWDDYASHLTAWESEHTLDC